MKLSLMYTAFCIGLLALVGCGSQNGKSEGTPTKTVAKVIPNDDGGHGWWCDEHGVKEKECSMCQKEVFTKLKPDEICPKHSDRAKAQCFICNPELWAKSAAVYKAQYGKEPPEPKENMVEKK